VCNKIQGKVFLKLDLVLAEFGLTHEFFWQILVVLACGAMLYEGLDVTRPS